MSSLKKENRDHPLVVNQNVSRMQVEESNTSHLMAPRPIHPSLWQSWTLRQLFVVGRRVRAGVAREESGEGSAGVRGTLVRLPDRAVRRDEHARELAGVPPPVVVELPLQFRENTI